MSNTVNALRGLVSLLDEADPVEVGCHCTSIDDMEVRCVWCTAKDALKEAEATAASDIPPPPPDAPGLAPQFNTAEVCDDYQDKVYSFALYPGRGGKALGVLYTLLGLLNEAGELAEKVLPLVNASVPPNGLPTDIKQTITTIVGHAKLAGQMKKAIRDKGKLPIPEKPNFNDQGQLEKLTSELGDVLWYVQGLAKELGLKLSDVAYANIVKLVSRADRGKLQGDGDNR